MVSSIRPTDSIEDLEANTFWDGVFLLGTSVLTALGLSLLWVALRRDRLSYSTKTLIASMLFGTGAFNVVEGLIDHHLLGIHHVKSGPNQIFWDLGFLVLSSVLAGVGLFLLQSRSYSQNSETQIE